VPRCFRRPRRAGGSPRDRLDVAVLETEVLEPAGVTREMISGGALTYTRDPDGLDAARAKRRSDPRLRGVPVTPGT